MNKNLAERDIYGSKRIGADFTPVQLIGALPVSMIDTFGRYLGMKQYEMDNHLGNVLTTISDRKIPISYDTTTGSDIDHYEADVLSSQDYYPFGWMEPHRNFNSSTYRFGYQSSLKDDEIYGENNSYTTFFREYDPRIGRWWTLDPEKQKYADWSPYSYAFDNPVYRNDPDGDSPGENDDGQKRADASKNKKFDQREFTYYCNRSNYHDRGQTNGENCGNQDGRTTNCSRFTKEINDATGGSQKFPTAAAGQAKWLKDNGEFFGLDKSGNIDLCKAKVGDYVYFHEEKKNKNTGKYVATDITHTGIITKITGDGIITFMNATVNKQSAPTIMENQLGPKGNITTWPKHTGLISGFGRPKSEDNNKP